MIALFVGLITFSQVGRPALRDSCKIARFIVRFIFHCEIHFSLGDSFFVGRFIFRWEIYFSLGDSFFIVRFIFLPEIHFSTREVLVTVSDGRVRFICFGSICLKKNPKLRFSR